MNILLQYKPCKVKIHVSEGTIHRHWSGVKIMVLKLEQI